MTARTAWVVWDHHHGMDVRDADSGLTVQEKMEKAFKAGWDSAGGDQRLDTVDRVENKIEGCCGIGSDSAKDIKHAHTCTRTPCWWLTRLLTTLKGEA